MSDVTFLVFDMDQVLYDYEHAIRLQLLHELTGRPEAEIDRALWGGPHENAAEAGKPDTAEGYLAQYAELLQFPIDFETFADIRRRMMRPRSDVLDMVRTAAGTAEVALLTNNGMALKKALPICAPEVVAIFGERAHVSAEFGARKPEEEVYLRICQRYRHAPERTLFVDDRLENVEGAERAGLLGHHFTGSSGLRTCLSSLGFLSDH